MSPDKPELSNCRRRELGNSVACPSGGRGILTRKSQNGRGKVREEALSGVFQNVGNIFQYAAF